MKIINPLLIIQYKNKNKVKFKIKSIVPKNAQMMTSIALWSFYLKIDIYSRRNIPLKKDKKMKIEMVIIYIIIMPSLEEVL